jgi:hypothetical protein
MNTKRCLHFLGATLLLVFFTFGLRAQSDLEPYTWDTYGMAFSIPKTFSVLENDSVKFSAADSLVNLTIYPVDATGIDSTNMDSLLGQWASQNNVEVLSNYEPFNDEGNYFGILCVGTLNSYSIMLMLAIDPDYKDTGFYIWFSYNTDSFETVMQIVNSFYPI